MKNIFDKAAYRKIKKIDSSAAFFYKMFSKKNGFVGFSQFLFHPFKTKAFLEMVACGLTGVSLSKIAGEDFVSYEFDDSRVLQRSIWALFPQPQDGKIPDFSSQLSMGAFDIAKILGKVDKLFFKGGDIVLDNKIKIKSQIKFPYGTFFAYGQAIAFFSELIGKNGVQVLSALSLGVNGLEIQIGAKVPNCLLTDWKYLKESAIAKARQYGAKVQFSEGNGVDGKTKFEFTISVEINLPDLFEQIGTN